MNNGKELDDLLKKAAELEVAEAIAHTERTREFMKLIPKGDTPDERIVIPLVLEVLHEAE